jgi:hypothetical protein
MTLGVSIKCHYAECRSAECRYADYRGAVIIVIYDRSESGLHCKYVTIVN